MLQPSIDQLSELTNEACKQARVFTCAITVIIMSSVSDDSKKEQLMDIVAGVQSSRINDQRANFPGLNRQEVVNRLLTQRDGNGIPDDNFFDQLMRCQVRIILFI